MSENGPDDNLNHPDPKRAPVLPLAMSRSVLIGMFTGALYGKLGLALYVWVTGNFGLIKFGNAEPCWILTGSLLGAGIGVFFGQVYNTTPHARRTISVTVAVLLGAGVGAF